MDIFKKFFCKKEKKTDRDRIDKQLYYKAIRETDMDEDRRFDLNSMVAMYYSVGLDDMLGGLFKSSDNTFHTEYIVKLTDKELKTLREIPRDVIGVKRSVWEDRIETR